MSKDRTFKFSTKSYKEVVSFSPSNQAGIPLWKQYSNTNILHFKQGLHHPQTSLNALLFLPASCLAKATLRPLGDSRLNGLWDQNVSMWLEYKLLNDYDSPFSYITWLLCRCDMIGHSGLLILWIWNSWRWIGGPALPLFSPCSLLQSENSETIPSHRKVEFFRMNRPFYADESGL